MFAFLLETFALGLKNLRLHKLRSLLTALGIIFGVAAVIIMVAIGDGSRQKAMKQMEQLGAQNVLVRSVRPPRIDEASGRSTNRVLEYGLKRADLTRLQTLPNLLAIVPLRDTEQKVIVESKEIAANAIATTPKFFDMINLRLDKGRLFTDVDYDSSSQVCVIGARAARNAFPYQDPIGQTIQIGSPSTSMLLLTVVGVLEPTGLRPGSDGMGITTRDIDADVYFPLTLSERTFGSAIVKRESGSFERKNIELSEIWLRADSREAVERTAGQARQLVEVVRLRPNDVDVKAPIEILRQAEQLNRLFNFIMVGIASFSLVVGGIGIMNIMLATVTERTKEIGIRRALGAKRNDITLQFLIETTVISLAGGLLGIGIGSGSAILLPILVKALSGGDYPTSITPWSVIGSFAVSGLIGVGFGMYPALQAARMNPIEALRHE